MFYLFHVFCFSLKLHEQIDFFNEPQRVDYFFKFSSLPLFFSFLRVVFLRLILVQILNMSAQE